MVGLYENREWDRSLSSLPFREGRLRGSRSFDLGKAIFATRLFLSGLCPLLVCRWLPSCLRDPKASAAAYIRVRQRRAFGRSRKEEQSRPRREGGEWKRGIWGSWQSRKEVMNLWVIANESPIFIFYGSFRRDARFWIGRNCIRLFFARSNCQGEKA